MSLMKESELLRNKICWENSILGTTLLPILESKHEWQTQMKEVTGDSAGLSIIKTKFPQDGLELSSENNPHEQPLLAIVGEPMPIPVDIDVVFESNPTEQKVDIACASSIQQRCIECVNSL